jgi:hypothetical protein
MDRAKHLAPLIASGIADDLRACKKRLRETSSAVDPFKSLRDHPFVAVTSAATLGMAVASPAARIVRSATTHRQPITAGRSYRVLPSVVAGHNTASRHVRLRPMQDRALDATRTELDTMPVAVPRGCVEGS